MREVGSPGGRIHARPLVHNAKVWLGSARGLRPAMRQGFGGDGGGVEMEEEGLEV